jgi:hypothetical protein
MTYQEYIKEAKQRLSGTDVKVLKTAAVEANSNLELDGAVLDGILEALEDKMSETEFVEFCETL